MRQKKLFNRKFGSWPLLLAVLFLLSAACSQPEHFLKDRAYRRLVHRQFQIRAELARGRQQELFSVLKGLTLEEREALEFLYAFMPLSDLANHDGQYFLEQVRTALQAKEYFSWGREIPEDIFRHFVLPYRVNNENPDRARQVFFEELKDRIKGLDMYRAALEVNHWCHEKVTYRPTDERTSAPLATVKTAFGRCGEESTLTVAALRAVSLPARQVYTPRWAHTDDNHAWVEVWVNGRWYYLGACEPEPELNRGWFSGPAKRAMMVHTTVFGQYRGPEEILQKTDLYTRINQLPMYAPTTRLTVEVRDNRGMVVPGARVEFCLYNYAEFYPLVSQVSDERGQASILTGLGDLLVLAYKDNLLAWQKVTAGATDRLVLTLSEPDFSERQVDLDIIPPVARPMEPADPTGVEENNRRLRLEDIIRATYESTFINKDIASIFAKEKGLPEDLTWKYLEGSRGNWPEIIEFLYQLKPEEFSRGLGLLANITAKDLRDTPAEVLLHHLREAPPREEELDEETYLNFVLSPRIGRELLSPWRQYIIEKLSQAEKQEFKKNPEKITGWIQAHIKLDDSNYYQVPLLPQGSLQLGRADVYSMKVLFVALARCLGVPARIDRATGRACYLAQGQWQELVFGEESGRSELPVKSGLILKYQPVAGLPRPSYYSHFTLARFSEGQYRTLDYENEPALNSFPCQLQVDPGHYLLISGNRQPDGSVLCRLKFFEVEPNKTKEVNLSLRTNLQEPEVLGQFKPEAEVYDLKSQSGLKLSTLATGKNFILLLIEPEREPSQHLMEEIQALSGQFEGWPGLLLVAVARDSLPAGFEPTRYKALPKTARLVYDIEDQIKSQLLKALGKEPAGLPAVLACRAGGHIIFYSEGYRIGSGEQLVRTLHWPK
ncbi:MAG: transglutaminase-like domain-containing protein [Candidatus Saccharicenans sp.]|jgi:transglutaminase-like putative cysteine protease|nr:transglutaminase-like domain-containing protein [Candidatus Saccharicenans sp.]MDH7493814.1 transglutaminase-like domain-containing protein [Candidatus Saccharicenans sp.]